MTESVQLCLYLKVNWRTVKLHATAKLEPQVHFFRTVPSLTPVNQMASFLLSGLLFMKSSSSTFPSKTRPRLLNLKQDINSFSHKNSFQDVLVCTLYTVHTSTHTHPWRLTKYFFHENKILCGCSCPILSLYIIGVHRTCKYQINLFYILVIVKPVAVCKY